MEYKNYISKTKWKQLYCVLFKQNKVYPEMSLSSRIQNSTFSIMNKIRLWRLTEQFNTMKKLLLRIYNPLVWKLRLLYDYYMDFRLGIHTTGNSKSTVNSINGDHWSYMPTPYYQLEKIFDAIPFTPGVFYDLGCGKGRVLFYAAKHGYKNICGIELRTSMFTEVMKNYYGFDTQSDISVKFGDVLNQRLQYGGIYFMYNPFGVDTCTKVIERIRISTLDTPRTVRIVLFHQGNDMLRLYLKEAFTWSDVSDITPQCIMFTLL